MKLPTVVLIILIVCTVAFFWLIKPRLRHRPDWTAMSEQKYFAHRGLYNNHSNAPENSLRAFQRAVDQNFGIELDVHLTRDGVPVVIHDFELSRVCGENVEGRVEDYSYEELQKFRLFGTDQAIPTFAQVLNLIDGKVPLIVEMKTESFDIRVCEKAQALLNDYDGWYCVESFNPWAMFWYRRHYGKILRGQLSDDFFSYPAFRSFPLCLGGFILQFLLLNVLSRPDFVAYNCQYKDNLSRRLCRAWGGISVAWTVRSQEELDALQDDFDVFIFESFVPVQ